MVNDNGLRYFSTELCGEPKRELASPDREHALSAAERELLGRLQLEVIH